MWLLEGMGFWTSASSQWSHRPSWLPEGPPKIQYYNLPMQPGPLISLPSEDVPSKALKKNLSLPGRSCSYDYILWSWHPFIQSSSYVLFSPRGCADQPSWGPWIAFMDTTYSSFGSHLFSFHVLKGDVITGSLISQKRSVYLPQGQGSV